MKGNFLASLVLAILLTSCGTNKSLQSEASVIKSHENLNAILWVQTSVGFKMLCTQTYKWASVQLLQNLEDKTVTASKEQTNNFENLPPAVIVDIDETILDNSPFEARLIKNGQSYNDELWDKWVDEEKAVPIPGAKDFLDLAKQNGVKVFYVTNRKIKNEPQTLENLKKEIDPAITAEDILSKNEMPNWTSDKTSRRAFISKNYRILLLVGDDYNDFTYLGKSDVMTRNEMAQKQKEYWGKLWFVIPGPTYGSYENALLDYDHSLSEKQIWEKKTAHLNTEE